MKEKSNIVFRTVTVTYFGCRCRETSLEMWIPHRKVFHFPIMKRSAGVGIWYRG